MYSKSGFAYLIIPQVIYTHKRSHKYTVQLNRTNILACIDRHEFWAGLLNDLVFRPYFKILPHLGKNLVIIETLASKSSIPLIDYPA